MGHLNKIPKKFPFCSFSEALISFYLKGNRFQEDVVVFFRVATFYGIVNLFQIQTRTFDTMFQSEKDKHTGTAEGGFHLPKLFLKYS